MTGWTKGRSGGDEHDENIGGSRGKQHMRDIVDPGKTMERWINKRLGVLSMRLFLG